MKHVIFIITLFQALIFTNNAHAYLDAGTGSYLIQLLLAAIAAGMFFIKHYWNKLKVFFGSKSGEDDKID